MCMSCVAQSTPMLTVGFGLLRRQAVLAWVRGRLALVRRAPAEATNT